MANILIIIQTILLALMVYFIASSNKQNKTRKVVIDKENTKELEKLLSMRKINLTTPLTEKSRPRALVDIIGQEKGIKSLMAAICSSNPQHVIIYGPPGVGKTAAARLVLEKAKENKNGVFKSNAKFVEIDATTIRFDERGIADPLIGSVHDPIYQGAGAYGVAGIPQPKPGAVTKAHGGILFIDELGELHPIELNKLLKVLEDRKVFLESSYYSSEDPEMPRYIKEVFDNGLPADFRLIGATTRAPEEIAPAIRSRCIEIYFDDLSKKEIREIGSNAAKKNGFILDSECSELIGDYCCNGREVVNLVQMAIGIAVNEEREEVIAEDFLWVIENCKYNQRVDAKISENSSVGKVNGLAVYGGGLGTLLSVEVSAKKIQRPLGEVKITGVIEEENIKSSGRNLKRKSMILSSVDNALTILAKDFKMDIKYYDIHINFPGGGMTDGPSAGITIATGIFSAISGIKINNKVAMTGEISVLGEVKAIGGVKAKIKAAKEAGATRVIIPKDNYKENLSEILDIEICPVEDMKEVLKLSLLSPLISSDKELISSKIVEKNQKDENVS